MALTLARAAAAESFVMSMFCLNCDESETV